jgi:glycosyltransferase involved in cell wall biosynthesis
MIDELSVAGTETQLLALIERLDRRRVLPYLCLLRGENDVSRSLEPDCCPSVRLGINSLSRPATLLKIWRFARYLKDHEIDVLQVYFPDSTYAGVLAGRLAGVPHIVRTRNNLGYWMTRSHRLLGKVSSFFTDVLVANSQACRQAVMADEGIAPDRVVVLENGVDLQRFPIGAISKTTSRRIGIVANLRAVKGLDVFVRAAASLMVSHPEVTFHLAGDGEEKEPLQRLARDLDLGNRLVFEGTVADIPQFLASLEIAVLSSSSEGMSNALLEYMAACKPIVATRVGGNTSLIEDGVHGLLVEPENPGEVAKCLSRLLDDRNLARRLGEAARRRVEHNYSREAMVRRFEIFYENLVRGGALAA